MNNCIKRLHKKSQKHNKFKALAFLCLMTFPLFISGCKEQKPQEPPAAQSQGNNKDPVMRIAFVGNEYTTENNMLNMVPLMAKSDPSTQFNVEVGVHAVANNSLAQLWSHPATKTLLTPNSWDYVIIQPNSMWASSEGHVYVTQKSISAWSRLINNIQAHPVLFMTWPLERSHPTYADLKHMSTLKNYKNMHRMIHGYSKALAKKEGMSLAPVGNYWMVAMEKNPDINLYAPDGSTPSLEGSYLTALVIYKTLVDNTLDDITYIPQGMSEETKDALIAIASTKIEN